MSRPKQTIIPLAACLLVLFLPSLSCGQVGLTFLEGRLSSSDASHSSSARQWEYLQDLSMPFAFSISYLNEGHIDRPDKHHRDGFVFQIWARKPLLAPWFSLAVGAGPYYWYDTQNEHDDESHSDDFVRGLGLIGSASATIKLPYGGLYLQARLNRVETRNNIDTQSILIGIGTDFSSMEALNESLPVITEETRNEIILHVYNFKKTGAKGIEYRRNLGVLGGHIEAGIAYFLTSRSIDDEKESYGAAAQLWLVNTFRERLKFGIGSGVFLDCIDSPHEASGIVSLLGAFRISTHWRFQFCHSRIPPNERDEEDIWTLGVGYLF